MVVNILSNAVIEAALAGRPVLCVDLGGQPDIFQQQRFFGTVVRSEDELERRLRGVETDFAQALGQSRAFAEFHLAQGADGLAGYLEALVAMRNRRQATNGGLITAAIFRNGHDRARAGHGARWYAGMTNWTRPDRTAWPGAG